MNGDCFFITAGIVVAGIIVTALIATLLKRYWFEEEENGNGE